MMSETTYRKLTAPEIDALMANSCRCDDWSNVEVTDGFSPENIRCCTFRGAIRLGKNICIDYVQEEIAHYIIEDDVTIKNIESLVCTGKTRFGNGVRVAVLNETGGREVPIFDGLTAQIAYLTAMYRHLSEATENLIRLIDGYAKSIDPTLGRIGKGTVIAGCGSLTDICTGEYAVIRGASELTNGTVNSTKESPSTIGRGVIARHFIIADSSVVTDSAQLDHCFIGQGCRIGKGFTAEHSLFFANCDCQQGEAQAVFAGPYTVSHHKSTLLIGGMFSFYNAGSNSNQSNHMYRLGARHQGILERGCKTGSSSYILFPARIGAFSIVRGRHYSHADTSSLPFSYLIEEKGQSVVIPGASLKSIGTARDIGKWPMRDKRKGKKSDKITFSLLTPYTIQKVMDGVSLLKAMDKAGVTEHNRVRLTARGIDSGKEAYQMALYLYLGEIVANRLERKQPLSPGPKSSRTDRQWTDLGGWVVPAIEVERLLAETETMKEIDQLEQAIDGMAGRHPEWEWSFAAYLWEEITGKPFAEISVEDTKILLEEYIHALKQYEQAILSDASKEYGEKMRVSYGVDGDELVRDAEFAAIHENLGASAFLQDMQVDFADKRRKVKALVSGL